MKHFVAKFFTIEFKKKYYSYFVIFLLSFVTLIWLHGYVLFFWDEVLPVYPYYDITHLIYIWFPANLGVLNTHADQMASYYILWFIFSMITFHSLFLTEQLIMFTVFMISGFSSYTLLNFIFSKFGMPVKHSSFALIGAIFYMFNYFDAFLFYEIQPYWISYSLLPLVIYFILYGFTKLNSNTNILKYSLLDSFLLEITFSFSFYIQPVIIYVILIIISYYLIFKSRIHLKNSRKSLYYILFILLFTLLLNFWWYDGFLNLVKVDSNGSSASVVISGVAHEFLYNGYKLKFWSVIALYPTLTPLKNNNDYPFIGMYSSYASIFFIISILFFIIILLPLINIKSKYSLLNKREKIKLYILLFILLFFGIQGANPLNRIIFEMLKIHLPFILPYLYATSYYFIEIPIISIYLLLFPTAIFEIINFKLDKKYTKYFFKALKNYSINIKQKKMIAIILVFLIIGIFPYYMFTPDATMYYDDCGHKIPSTNYFPPYFYKFLDYIHDNANSSTTLILPQSLDFFSVNFSNNNTFVDDESPVYLTGSEDLIYEPNLTNQIDDFISGAVPNSSHFSLYLNDINIKYIVVDKNVSSFISGYDFITNTSKILNYINSRPNLSLVGSYGPLLLYKNDNYNGLITSGNYSYFNPSISEPYGELNIMPYMKNLSFNSQVGKYKFNDGNLSLMAVNESEYNYSLFPVDFQNSEPMNVNISNYNYLVIKTGEMSNSSLMYILTKTFFINGDNGKIGNTLLSPMNLTNSNLESTCELLKSNTTYVLPLYQYGSSGYATPINKASINKNGTILNYIDLAIGRLKDYNVTYTVNITNMYFAKFISPEFNGYEVMSLNSHKEIIIGNLKYQENESKAPPEIVFKEMNPTDYKIIVSNASAPFALLFKQNYNSGWQLSYNGSNIIKTHFEGDEYANAWIVNKTGNYTLSLIYEPQKGISEIYYISILINLLFVIILIGITIYSWRKIK